MDKLASLVSELVSILKGCHGDDELLGHVLSTLNTLVANHPAAVQECLRTEHRLQEILQEKLKGWSLSEHEVSILYCQVNSELSAHSLYGKFRAQSLPYKEV